MQEQKFSSGAFVFTRTRGLTPHDPSALRVLAERHGIDPEYLPTYAGDRTAFTRAIMATSRGLWRDGFLLRPIRRASAEVVYGIVREQRDEDGQRLDHDHEATVSWKSEPNPSVIACNHPIARRVAESYEQLKGKVVADDWSSSITSYLEAHDAAPMRGDGRVYWVPPQRIQDIRKLDSLLADVGIDLIMCELEPEAKTVARDVARESLWDDLFSLQAEVEGFDGKQRPSTYARRLEEYQRLRERAILYRDALGIGAEKAEHVLSELEERVSSMLDLRRSTVIHREGSTDSSTDLDLSPSPVDDEPVTIRFAGATFCLADSENNNDIMFVSGDETAKSAVASLETKGIAGKWQLAGPVRVCIQNSGPPGAAVSIRFQMPQSATLRDAASTLANLGIELT